MIKRCTDGSMIKLGRIYIMIIVFIHLGCNVIFGQNNTSSPYSIYGVGDVEPLGYSKIPAMGGAGFAIASNGFLNNTNPASYNGLDSLFSTFEIGVFGQQSKFESQNKKRTDYSANFQYLAMGFRVKNWWGMSVGLFPYSSVGYKIEIQDKIEGSLEPYRIVMEGAGGLTQFYIGNSFKVFDKLSVGVNAAYLFGPLDKTETYYINNSSSYSAYAENSYYLRRILLDYGLQYRFKIKDLDYSIGAVFSNNQHLKSNYSTSMYLNNGDTLISESSKMKNFTIPGKVGVGVAVSKDNKLTIAIDYSVQYWSASESLSESAKLVNSQQINWGFEYAPNDYHHANYLKMIRYWLGAYYKATNIELLGNQISQYGITAGVGLPINNLRSLANLSFEIGQKGTTTNNLIMEKYVILHLGVTLRETWFVKRKYE
jgi:hypothetical protein